MSRLFSPGRQAGAFSAPPAALPAAVRTWRRDPVWLRSVDVE